MNTDTLGVLSENTAFRQNKEKLDDKVQFIGVNEYFESDFNAVQAEQGADNSELFDEQKRLKKLADS